MGFLLFWTLIFADHGCAVIIVMWNLKFWNIHCLTSKRSGEGWVVCSLSTEKTKPTQPVTNPNLVEKCVALDSENAQGPEQGTTGAMQSDNTSLP